MSELRFWLWHRWFGHGDFWTETYTKTDRPNVTIRICEDCGRVFPEDVLVFGEAMLADLDAAERDAPP